MLCEKCHKNEATVHVNHIINGIAKEYNLCAACAGQSDDGVHFDNLMQAVIDAFANLQVFQVQSQKPAEPVNAVSNIKCGECGLSFEEFRKAGKLGCAECYTSFRGELSQIIKNIQGSNIHEGKIPKRVGETFVQSRNINRLRAQLKKAVETEDFESAAELRDQIRALEGV